MAEIRSTLDIIMERTRGLKLSSGEKRAFHEEEIRRTVKGLLQRYLDGQINRERLRAELGGMVERDRDSALAMLRRECAQRLEPWADNGPILDLLREAAGVDTETLDQVLKEAREELEREMTDQSEALRKQYEARGISGSAITPNPDSDPEWRRHVSERQAGVRDKLAVLVSPGPGGA